MTLEQVFNGIITVVGGVVLWLIAQWSRLRGDVNQLKTDVAVLNVQYRSIPESMREVKDEIKGLRGDLHREMETLRQKVDEKADRT